MLLLYAVAVCAVAICGGEEISENAMNKNYGQNIYNIGGRKFRGVDWQKDRASLCTTTNSSHQHYVTEVTYFNLL
jgi:hypothetical protein